MCAVCVFMHLHVCFWTYECLCLCVVSEFICGCVCVCACVYACVGVCVGVCGCVCVCGGVRGCGGFGYCGVSFFVCLFLWWLLLDEILSCVCFGHHLLFH